MNPLCIVGENQLLLKNIYNFNTAGEWDCVVVVELSALARIRKGQGAKALNRALCVASQKLGYTGGGNVRG